jgi:3-oxoacyl-[acyl-carrier protein] reductase
MFHNCLKDKIALVTGASRGIGQGSAEKITQYLQAQGFNGAGVVLNVTSQDSIQTALQKIKTQYGSIHILVNNAAVTKDNLLLRMKDDEWLQVIETNLNAIYHLSKALIRDMLKARWGRIINIGSVVGTTGNPGQANYCAAKAGLLGFSKALALEVGSRDITVNTVSPGYIATDMTNMLTDEQKQAIFDRIPMQKIGAVEDIAAAVVFFASPMAGYITGQTLHVNGGMYMN